MEALPKQGAEELEEIAYDPGFLEAVTAGRMSPRQALHKGDRMAHARGLAERHGMTLNVALRVTDNEISLHQAMLQLSREKAARLPEPQRAPVTRHQSAVVLVAAGTCLVGLALYSWFTWNRYVSRTRDVAMSVASGERIRAAGSADGHDGSAPGCQTRR